jgi:hypothetical protein
LLILSDRHIVMKNRLEVFREYMAAFNGASDPAQALDNGFYVEEPRQSVSQVLSNRISIQPESKSLLLGGIGSGKTTQLLKIAELLNHSQENQIHAHYVDVTRYTNLASLQPGLLAALTGLELIHLIEVKGEIIDPQTSQIIREYAYGTTEKSLLSVQHSVPQDRSYRVSIVPKIHLANQPIQVTSALSRLVEIFRKTYQSTIFFIFDGLDRVDELDIFIQVMMTDITELGGVGFLAVGPASLPYSEFTETLDSTFNHIQYRAAFEVNVDENYNVIDQSSFKFFHDIIKKRSQGDIFNPETVRKLILLSGGILRDLINLAQESIQEAYLMGCNDVKNEHIQVASESMARRKLLGLKINHIQILKGLTKSEVFTPNTPEKIYLLSSGRILEYLYPENRFRLHPSLKSYLQDNQI